MSTHFQSIASAPAERRLAQPRDALERLETALALAFTAAFGVIALLRLSYPFEVSWMESAMHQMVERRLHGLSIYTAPSLEYAPCLYPPLYFELSALLAKVLPGPGPTTFFAMRDISIASWVGLFALTTRLLRHNGASLRRSLCAAAILFACYGRFECWQDNSRVDSLYCLLLFAATALLVRGRTRSSAILSGVCFGLSILAKQPAAVLMVLSAIQVALTWPKARRSVFALTAAIATVVAYLAATGDLGNPMLYHYVLAVPASHALSARLFVRGVFFLPVMLPFLCWAAAAGPLAELRRGATCRAIARSCPWSVTLWLWLVPTLLFRAKEGASINFFMPLVPVAILAFEEGARLFKHGRALSGRILPFLLPLQLLALAYDPRPRLPTNDSTIAAGAIVARLRQVQGPVWFPTFPSFAAYAGKPWFAHEVPLADLAHTDPSVVGVSLESAIRNRTFGAIVLPPKAPLESLAVDAGYLPESLPETEDRFMRTLFHYHVGPTLLVAPPVR